MGVEVMVESRKNLGLNEGIRRSSPASKAFEWFREWIQLHPNSPIPSTELMVHMEAIFMALDCLSLGVLFLDGCGKASWGNRAASDILEKGDGLRLVGQRLEVGTFPDEARLLEAHLREALGACWSSRPRMSASLRISRGEGGVGQHLFIIPLRSEHGPFLDIHAPAVAVLISDMEQSAGMSPQAIQSLYGLSAAEARVALKLLSGCNAEAASDALAISMNTLRTHLKRIFDKTGVRSQAELMRLLLSGPAQLRLH